jgi:hypothetical protein
VTEAEATVVEQTLRIGEGARMGEKQLRRGIEARRHQVAALDCARWCAPTAEPEAIDAQSTS